MRGRGPLLLLMLLSGCLAPIPEDVSTPAPAQREGERQEITRSGEPAPRPERPDPPATEDSVPAPEPTPPEQEERLIVACLPEVPAAGDTLAVTIDAPVRWPAPTCLINQVPARDVGVVPHGGGEVASFPATERDGRYLCERAVLAEAGAIILSVTRADGNLTRIHGPHVIPVTGDRIQQRVAFESFSVETGDDGLPFARASVPLQLANYGAPSVGPLFGWNATHTSISLEIIPRGNVLHMGDYAQPIWISATEFEATIDVPALIERAEREMESDFPSDAYLLAAVGHASNDIAFATSEGFVGGFGGCADGSCFVRDG